ncbi:MAG: succinate dehydrogenase cytochrome b subunit [Bacteroidetes bacterium]|nr:succinate dehydrogenase cytochrome b subunit [Bacteroidota bacterium]
MKLFSFLFNSSIGRKIMMAVTGLSLIAFLLVHCGVNALIFLNDGGETFNKAAEFMGTNWLIRTMEVGLFAGLLWHIAQGLYLWADNAKKRKNKYGKPAGNANSTWYSRSMGLLGTLLLLFLILHLKHFWVISRFTDEITSGEETLFGEMMEVFGPEGLIPVIVYVLGCISLAYHLLHGFSSAFQSLGINHSAYNPIIKGLGQGFSILIPLVFALMPLAMHFGLVQ